MITSQSIVVGAGLFFLFVFLSGIWLSRIGRPLHGGILTIHKLVSLAAGIFLIIAFYQLYQVTGLSTTEVSAVVISGLLFLATGISGALLSGDKLVPPAAILRLHQITPVLTLLSTALSLYMVLSRT